MYEKKGAVPKKKGLLTLFLCMLRLLIVEQVEKYV